MTLHRTSSRLAAGIGAMLTALTLAAATPANADQDHVTARRLLQSGEILSLEKIIERARAVKPGDILETELDSERGRYYYELEILDNAGWVWELKFDARTGELIKMERDD